MTEFGTSAHIFETGTAATGMLMHLVAELSISSKEQEDLLAGVTEIYAPLITVMSLSSTGQRVRRLLHKQDALSATFGSERALGVRRVSEQLLRVLNEESNDTLEMLKSAIRARWPEMGAKGDAMTKEEIEQAVEPVRAQARELMKELGIADDSSVPISTMVHQDLVDLSVAVLNAMPKERFASAYQELKDTGIDMKVVDVALAAEVRKTRAAKMSAEPSITPEDLLSPEEMARARSGNEKVASDD